MTSHLDYYCMASDDHQCAPILSSGKAIIGLSDTRRQSDAKVTFLIDRELNDLHCN